MSSFRPSWARKRIAPLRLSICTLSSPAASSARDFPARAVHAGAASGTQFQYPEPGRGAFSLKNCTRIMESCTGVRRRVPSELIRSRKRLLRLMFRIDRSEERLAVSLPSFSRLTSGIEPNRNGEGLTGRSADRAFFKIDCGKTAPVLSAVLPLPLHLHSRIPAAASALFPEPVLR